MDDLGVCARALSSGSDRASERPGCRKLAQAQQRAALSPQARRLSHSLRGSAWDGRYSKEKTLQVSVRCTQSQTCRFHLLRSERVCRCRIGVVCRAGTATAYRTARRAGARGRRARPELSLKYYRKLSRTRIEIRFS
jgi:hypothetical protein